MDRSRVEKRPDVIFHSQVNDVRITEGEGRMTWNRSARRPPLSPFLQALAFMALPVLASAGQAPASTNAPVTFTKDIAPLLQRSCQNCHRPGSVAPMSLSIRSVVAFLNTRSQVLPFTAVTLWLESFLANTRRSIWLAYFSNGRACWALEA